MGDNYVCKLDEASQKKAKEELGEDEKQRMSSVETLRKWLQDRKDWINIPTDTKYLLGFLRMKKFNQLATRESLIKAWKLRSKHAVWYKDVDPADPKIQAALSTGYQLPLPGRDKHGRKVVISSCAAFDTSGKQYNVDDVIKGYAIVQDYMTMDEDVQVNGFVYLMDMTGFSMNHMTFMGFDAMTDGSNCWMNAHCGRNKEMHFYNGGNMFDVLYGILKKAFPKKLQDRVINHGSNLFPIYDYIDKATLPEEFLPDDYDGPTAGPKQKLVDDLLGKLRDPDFQKYMANLSSQKYFVNMDKKPKDDEQASYRPLVD